MVYFYVLLVPISMYFFILSVLVDTKDLRRIVLFKLIPFMSAVIITVIWFNYFNHVTYMGGSFNG